MIVNSNRRLHKLLTQISKENLKTGAISGGFDIFHDGHKLALEFAAKHVDKLFVLINSDKSIKAYKGKQRPYNSFAERVAVLNKAYPNNVYIKMDELTPNHLLEKIRPNMYFLSKEWTTSPVELKALQQIKCEIVSHPQAAGISTTALSKEKIFSNSAVFFDRDGTINEDFGYIKSEELVKISKKNLETMKKFASLPCLLFIVTNQSGVSKKIIKKKEFIKVNNKVINLIEDNGGRIDKVYYDFSSDKKPSKYRKPNIGMVLKAVKQFDISLVNSWVIGDKDSDIELGKNSNMKTIYLKNNKYKYKSILKPDFTVDTLEECYEIISQK